MCDIVHVMCLKPCPTKSPKDRGKSSTPAVCECCKHRMPLLYRHECTHAGSTRRLSLSYYFSWKAETDYYFITCPTLTTVTLTRISHLKNHRIRLHSVGVSVYMSRALSSCVHRTEPPDARAVAPRRLYYLPPPSNNS